MKRVNINVRQNVHIFWQEHRTPFPMSNDPSMPPKKVWTVQASYPTPLALISIDYDCHKSDFCGQRLSEFPVSNVPHVFRAYQFFQDMTFLPLYIHYLIHLNTLAGTAANVCSVISNPLREPMPTNCTHQSLDQVYQGNVLISFDNDEWRGKLSVKIHDWDQVTYLQLLHLLTAHRVSSRSPI